MKHTHSSFPRKSKAGDGFCWTCLARIASLTNAAPVRRNRSEGRSLIQLEHSLYPHRVAMGSSYHWECINASEKDHLARWWTPPSVASIANILANRCGRVLPDTNSRRRSQTLSNLLGKDSLIYAHSATGCFLPCTSFTNASCTADTTTPCCRAGREIKCRG